jgi:hypothetical protein
VVILKRQISYIVHRLDMFAVQVCDRDESGREHEVDWMEGLSYNEATIAASDTPEMIDETR